MQHSEARQLCAQNNSCGIPSAAIHLASSRPRPRVFDMATAMEGAMTTEMATAMATAMPAAACTWRLRRRCDGNCDGGCERWLIHGRLRWASAILAAPPESGISVLRPCCDDGWLAAMMTSSRCPSRPSPHTRHDGSHGAGARAQRGHKERGIALHMQGGYTCISGFGSLARGVCILDRRAGARLQL